MVFPVRVLALAGIRCLIATCAAGGISPRATPGSFMVFSDHLNLQGVNPLAGTHDPRWGERFVDMSEAYDSRLRRGTQSGPWTGAEVLRGRLRGALGSQL